MYRVRGRFIARETHNASRNKLRSGRDTSGPYKIIELSIKIGAGSAGRCQRRDVSR